MTGIARLYTRPETVDMQQTMPLCELDARLIASLGTAVIWADQPQTRCTVCDTPLNRSVTYLVVLLPSDPEMGLGVSGAVCGNCGGLPRAALQAHADEVAMLLFEPVAGRA
jgi:hypothetical protein